MAGPFAAFLRRTPITHYFWALSAAAPSRSLSLAPNPTLLSALDTLSPGLDNPCSTAGRDACADTPADPVIGPSVRPSTKFSLPIGDARFSPALAAPAAAAAVRNPITDSTSSPSWPVGEVRLSTVLAAILRQRLPRSLARLLLRRWRARTAAAARAAGRDQPVIAAADDASRRRASALMRFVGTRCPNFLSKVSHRCNCLIDAWHMSAHTRVN